MQFVRLARPAWFGLVSCLVLANCGGDPAPEAEPPPDSALEPLSESLLTNDEDLLASSADLADVRIRWRLNEAVDRETLAKRVEGQFEAWEALPVPGEAGTDPEWLLHLPSKAYPDLLNWFETAAKEAGVLEVRGEPTSEGDAVFVRVQLILSGGSRP